MELEPISNPTSAFFCPPPNILKPLQESPPPVTCRNMRRLNLGDRTRSAAPQLTQPNHRYPVSPSHRHQLRSARTGDRNQTAASCNLLFFVIRSASPDWDPRTPSPTSVNIP